MRKKTDGNLFVGLDIGTTKVVALVGAVGLGGHIDVMGIGSHPSRGLKRGVVINIDATVQSIKHAIEEAESNAGCQIHSVYTGIAGGHIRSFSSHGIVAVRDREVGHGDVERVIDAAKAVAIPADQKILHILPQEFIIDGQEGIRDPVGMAGVRLEAKVHIVTGSVSAAQNIMKCIEQCGLQVSDIILQPLASSAAVLVDDEKDLGTCLIDIGGGTTDIAVFAEGAIRHSAVIPIAGDQVTNDIAVSLRVPTKYAEEIKIKHANLSEEVSSNGSNIIISGANVQRQAREISNKMLSEVVGARYEEIFSLVLAELRRSRFEDVVSAGVVLTGGAAKMNGVAELAEKVFQLPVRVGMAQNVGGLADVINNPVYATGIGLLLLGNQHYQQGRLEALAFSKQKSLWMKMKNWFQVNF